MQTSLEKLGRFKSILNLLLVTSVFAFASGFQGGFFSLAEGGKQTSVLALTIDSAYPLSYDTDGDSKQSYTMTYAQGADKIAPLSGNNFGYSTSPDISVQQNVTQQNICSSNTAYCYNEVDNDFNVNPP